MAFGGLKAFDRGMCSLMSNQPMNSLFDMPKIIGNAFMQQGRLRILGNGGLRKKFADSIDQGVEGAGLGKLDVAKSMFYNQKGELSYARAGAATTAGIAATGIAGSYIFGSDK